MKMKPVELGFLQNNPGAVRHGNFINYYAFNSVESRLEHLDYKMFPTPESDKILVLDVGCNSGDLTFSLHNYLETRYEDCTIDILAIDLDPSLISKAREINEKRSFIQYEVGNIMDEDGKNVVQEYLQKHGKECFDFTFCFSVTMWIHLNNGDEGLVEFLYYIRNISTSFIIEPQLWKCYKAAQRRLKKAGGSFENYPSLKIRGKVDTVIENVCTENGDFVKIFETQVTSWGRKVQCYRSKDKLSIQSHLGNRIAYI